MELGTLILSYQELASYTDNFSDNNYISHFQFGKFYRGKIDHAEWTQYVLVKTWEIPEIYNYLPGDNETRLLDEVALLSHEVVTNHPGMIKLYGICIEGDLVGAVYDFKPFESVYNLIPKDDFGWLQRIKVALNLARLLKFLGTRKGTCKPYIVRNLDCAHILLDEDYNAKLCDFGLITGGIFPDRTIYRGHHVRGCYGYIDVSAFLNGFCIFRLLYLCLLCMLRVEVILQFSSHQIDKFVADNYTTQIDVYAFGAILINLISKRVYNIEDKKTVGSMVTDWARGNYEDYDEAYEDADSDVKIPKFSIVHESLAADPDFVKGDEHKISTLAIECTNGWTMVRPTIKQVLRRLLKLKVVKQHAKFLGVKKL